jgi:RHS repeat-associated protein
MKIIHIVSLAFAASFLAATNSQAKYCDDETDLVYYGYRYYNPSAGRWLSRDPLGDWSFLSSRARSKPFWEQISLLNESLLPSYAFVQNDGIDAFDLLGLDRWRIFAWREWDPIHSYIVVQDWDACCKNVVGYYRIEFGPRHWWAAILGPGEVTITPWRNPGNQGEHKASTCNADRILLGWARTLQKNPPFYDVIGFNCDTFSAYAINVGIGY